MNEPIDIAGRLEGIEPLRVRELPRFLAAVEPVARELAAGDVLAALARHADGVIEATAIGAGVPRDWLEQQTAEVLVALAARVLEVNADFFGRRVMPLLARAADRLAALGASGGTSSSPGSAAPASAGTP